MRRNELTHEHQKANLAEPLASKSWLRPTAKNFTDFAKNGVFQHHQDEAAVQHKTTQHQKPGINNEHLLFRIW